MSSLGFVDALARAETDGPVLSAFTTRTSMTPAHARFTTPTTGFWQVGKVLRVKAIFRISTFTSGTFTFSLGVGSVDAWASQALAMVASQTNQTCFLDLLWTCRAVGAGGSATANGIGVGSLNAGAAITASTTLLPATAPAVGTSFDPGAASVVDLMVACSVSNAANGLTLHEYVLEPLNRSGCAVRLTNGFQGLTNGTTLTQGVGGNTGGVSGDFFDLISGPVTAASAGAAHETMGMSCAAAAGEAYAMWGPFTAGTFTTLYSRAYLRNMTAPPANCKLISILAGATVGGRCNIDSTGHIVLTDSVGTAAGAASTTVVTGRAAPVRIEFKIIGDLTVGVLECRIFLTGDAVQPDETMVRTALNTGSTALDRVRFGPTGTAITATELIDDVGITEVDWMGPVGAGAFRPQKFFAPQRKPGRRRFTRPLQGDAIVAAGPINVDVDTATLTLAGIDPTLDGAGGTATATADVATLTLAGQDTPLAGSGASSTTADVAALTLTGQDAVLSSGALQVTVDTALLTLTGQDATLGGSGAATPTVDVAALTLTGITPTAAGSGAASVTADVAALILTGIDPAFTGTGAASTAADVAALTLAGQDTPLAGTGAATKAVDVAALLLSGIDVAASAGGSFVDVDPAALALTGLTPAFAGTGAGTVAVDVAALLLAGQDTPLAGSGATAKGVDIAALVLAGQDAVLSGFVADTNPLTATFRVGHTATARDLAGTATSRSRTATTGTDLTSSATARENR
jgi:hypothetical protein